MSLPATMSTALLGGLIALGLPVAAHSQSALLSEPGPTFTVPDNQLSKHVTVIAYGDMRFHDAADTNPKIANPLARQALVVRIAAEHPDAVQTNGDVPYRGSNQADYDVFESETKPWRDAHLRVYPAMGNHELSNNAEQGIANWWRAFPELKGRRWYSVALGSRIYIIQVDSNLPLTEGSNQMKWLQAQIAQLPKSVDFVMIGLHHPPVADIQTGSEADHNPRPNEIAMRDYLTRIAPTTHAQFIVTAGHTHNYERSAVSGVTYLVSGGGGAHPYEVERTPSDLYQGKESINFHYIKFELEMDKLKATMYRLADPDVKTVEWQTKDTFEIKKK